MQIKTLYQLLIFIDKHIFNSIRFSNIEQGRDQLVSISNNIQQILLSIDELKNYYGSDYRL